MFRSNRILVTILSAVILLACGSSSDPSNEASSSSSSSVTAQSACEHEFRVRIARCDSAPVRGDWGTDMAPATLASVRTRYVASCVDALSLKGSTRTADEIEACAKAVEAEQCGGIPELLPACTPKTGTLPAGSACNVDTQCQGGHCDLFDPQAKGKGCGICVEAVAEGQLCIPGVPSCEVGTMCVDSATEKETRCRRVSYANENATCDGHTILCHSGLMCATFDGATYNCVPRHTVGEDCPVDWACAMGTFCNLTTQKCAPLGNLGEACNSETPCNDALGCDTMTNTCAPLTFAEPGEKCGGSVACREGICGQGTGAPTCPALIEDGKACLEGAHTTCIAPAACIAGACVMADTATCQ